jgi:hypothetical protein
MPTVRKNIVAHQPPASPQTAVPADDGTVTLAVIQALIPLGLKAIEDALQQALVGRRYPHGEGAKRSS